MFYGEGAGTRRKLIKNTVKERQKDPIYKKAYEEVLNNQNMAEYDE
jgi:gp021